MSGMLDGFNSKLIKVMKSKKPNSSFLTKERYDDLLKKVSDSKSKTSGKKPEDYQRLKRYDVIKVDNVEKLIFPKGKDSSGVRFYVHFGELFNILHETHLSIGHGGRNKMIKELQKRYKNITTEEVMIYLNLCESCQKKSKVSNRGLVRQGVFQEMLNSRCQVDVIDMQTRPDSEFRFILVYQDCATKFMQLRPLITKNAREVAQHLIDIFTVFGAPSVVQSNNGRDFSSQIVEAACSIWPELKLVHGAPMQNTPDFTDLDIQKHLNFWLESNETKKWSDGLRFVQFIKNNELHDGLKCTPYEAMFGTRAKVGLKTSFPNDSIEHIKSEEELQSFIEISENIKTELNESDVDTNPLQSETDFNAKKEVEEEVGSVQTLESAKQRRLSTDDGWEKLPKIPKFFSGDRQEAEFETGNDPMNLLEVILEV